MRRPDLTLAFLAASLALCSGATGGTESSRGHVMCPPASLVDAAFRDAALQALDRLVIHAPGHGADGAIKAHHSPGHLDPQGAAWFYVSAYPANLGLIGALRVDPKTVPIAAQWLRWQSNHRSPTGPSESVVYDHWVRVSDGLESTCPPGKSARSCPQVDAFDSSAASLLLLAQALWQASAERPERALLSEPAMRRTLEEAATTLARLTQPNGLPWAKPDHAQAYLMDAVEVAAGWRAWSGLQREVYGIPQAANVSLAMAQRTEKAVQTQLWHGPSQTWRISLDARKADFKQWYPDTVAQAWPLLWLEGGDAASQTRARAAWQQASARWLGTSNWSERNVDPDGFWWPAIAVAAHCAGDDAAAAAWVARARQAWLRPTHPFAWPFQVGDLQWLFHLSDPITAPTP